MMNALRSFAPSFFLSLNNALSNGPKVSPSDLTPEVVAQYETAMRMETAECTPETAMLLSAAYVDAMTTDMMDGGFKVTHRMTDIPDSITVKRAESNAESLMMWFGGEKWILEGDVVDMIQTNVDFAKACILTVHDLQTADEREVKDTKHKNLFGFSKKHASKASMLADKIRAEKTLTEDETATVKHIAYTYRAQAHMAALGGVPVNRLFVA